MSLKPLPMHATFGAKLAHNRATGARIVTSKHAHVNRKVVAFVRTVPNSVSQVSTLTWANSVISRMPGSQRLQ